MQFDLNEIALAIVIGLGLVAMIVLQATGRGSSLLAPPFRAKALLNKSEQSLYRALIKRAPPDLRVLCQVSYGEILSCRNRKKFFSINSKRADFVICDKKWMPVGVVEYQGSGHFGSTSKSARNAALRDRVKRKAVEEAGLQFIEVPARYTVDELQTLLSPLRSGETGEQRIDLTAG